MGPMSMCDNRTYQLDHRGIEKLLPSGRRRSGFTLMEALLASTILAIVASSAVLPLAAGVQQVNAAAELEQATALGEAMMEEVLARPFFEPGQTAPTLGADVGEANRSNFKSIDDFDGYFETAISLKTFQNNNITDAAVAGFWRSVSVEYVTFPNQEPEDVNSFMHIQVKVYHDSVLLVTLDRIVSRED